tara:strand:- start:605 stop:1495 length:891 start_codon:yes stop_codon:yes gene_type:complete
LLLVVAAGTSHGLRAEAADHLRATRRYEALYEVPDPAVLPALSLGYERALADVLWMTALVYIGDEFANEGSVDHAFRYTDAILALDPDFRAVYLWVGVVGLYRPQAIERSDVDRVIAYQRGALERFPDDGELRWDLASNLQYELVPFLRREGRTEELGEAEAEAADLFLEAAARGAAPAWMVVTSANKLDEFGQREHAIEQLQRLFLLVDDAPTRQNIANQLQQLRGAQLSATITADLERFEREHEAYPWVPPGLFALIRPLDTASASDAAGRLMGAEGDAMLHGPDAPTESTQAP